MTLTELVQAHRGGTLRSGELVLVLDNDSCSAWDGDGQQAFEMHPDELLRAALDQLGIAWEEV